MNQGPGLGSDLAERPTEGVLEHRQQDGERVRRFCPSAQAEPRAGCRALKRLRMGGWGVVSLIALAGGPGPVQSTEQAGATSPDTRRPAAPANLVRKAEAGLVFRAGAFAQDVTPKQFPVLINGGFLSATAQRVHDPLHVRWLVLDDGETRVAFGLLDTCLIPTEFVAEVRAQGARRTGLKPEHIMLAATHTHSAPSLMRCLGTEADPHYPAFALPRIVEGLQRALENLAPARIGWAVTSAPAYTHTRVWIRRPDRMLTDPFGQRTVRAHMHPGHQSPDVIGPSGPSDPELTVLGVQSHTGRPMAVLANYAMHYFGAPAVSADYFGRFADKLAELLGVSRSTPAFVGIMSQGTSGDQQWMDYSQPKPTTTLDGYATELARLAAAAYRTIRFHNWVPLGVQQRTLHLATRQPDAARLAWAQRLVEAMSNRPPKDIPEVYAREQLWLQQNPGRAVPVQAVRVGQLGIALWPCEVFALSGLKVKVQSPLQPTFNIELANGAEGYIPPPELYPLGGYNTWPCRTAASETNAEPKLVEAMVELLEELSGRPRRPVSVAHGPYAEAVLAARPLAYWRLEEWGGPTAQDATGHGHQATYEPGIARWLEGPSSPAFSGPKAINRCAHFAGGRLRAVLADLGPAYTVELWFWNGLPQDVRTVTGCLLVHGNCKLILTGKGPTPGRLQVGPWTGGTELATKRWHYVALVRDGRHLTVYLNGQTEPELTGELAAETSGDLYFGGSGDPDETFEGKLDEVAVYGRALSAAELRAHYVLGSAPRPADPPAHTR